MSHKCCNCCLSSQDEWTDLKTEGTVSFSFPYINGLSIEVILQNWLQTSKLLSFPETLISLISRFVTLDNVGNMFKVPEKIQHGRYTKINITKHTFIANVLQPRLGMCSFEDMLKGTIPFPNDKTSSMTIVYNHDLPTLDLKEIEGFGNDDLSPTHAMEVIYVVGIRDMIENNETNNIGEYMILNVNDERPKDICIRKAFKVLDTKNKTIKTQIICDFARKNEKTVTFIVNGRKLIPKINKDKDYSLNIKQEHHDVKFVPFVYCKLYMKIHFPQWKYRNVFPQSPESSDSDDLEEIN